MSIRAKAARTGTSCCRRDCGISCATGGEWKSPPTGSFPAISRDGTSARMLWNWPVRKRAFDFRFPSPLRRTAFDTRLPCTCSNPEPTSTRYNCYSVTAASLLQPDTCASPPPRCAQLRARSICCLIVCPSISLLRLRFFERHAHGSPEAGSGGCLSPLRRSLPRTTWRVDVRAAFTRHLATLKKREWVVYAKAPFAGPEQVLDYVGRYTHRVAISNNRLLDMEDDQIRFRWKDYRQGDQVKTMALTADEFIRRFLLHVLPNGLRRIRYYGFMGNRHRKARSAGGELWSLSGFSRDPARELRRSSIHHDPYRRFRTRDEQVWLLRHRATGVRVPRIYLRTESYLAGNSSTGSGRHAPNNLSARSFKACTQSFNGVPGQGRLFKTHSSKCRPAVQSNPFLAHRRGVQDFSSLQQPVAAGRWPKNALHYSVCGMAREASSFVHSRIRRVAGSAPKMPNSHSHFRIGIQCHKWRSRGRRPPKRPQNAEP